MTRESKSAARTVAPGTGVGSMQSGAGEGDRTLVLSLGSFCSTIELHPRKRHFTRFSGCFVSLEVAQWYRFCSGWLLQAVIAAGKNMQSHLFLSSSIFMHEMPPVLTSASRRDHFPASFRAMIFPPTGSLLPAYINNSKSELSVAQARTNAVRGVWTFS